MAYYRDPKETEKIRARVLYAAAKLFLEKGFVMATVKDIAEEAEVNKSTLMYIFRSKEEILSALVAFVLEGQFETVTALLKGKTEDKILFYATEAAFQLHLAETGEHIRELYTSSYSLPKSTASVQNTFAEKLEEIFGPYLPGYEGKDFFEMEIALSGVMRGFMTEPCDRYFTMERKVARFLECAFRLFKIPEEKTREAIAFVAAFDLDTLAKETLDKMLSYLAVRIEEQ